MKQMIDSILCAQQIIESARVRSDHPLHYFAKKVSVDFCHCAALAEMYDQLQVFISHFDCASSSQVNFNVQSLIHAQSQKLA